MRYIADIRNEQFIPGEDRRGKSFHAFLRPQIITGVMIWI